MSRLDLVVGPNGAGKSTFVRLVLAPALRGSVFVNADEIAAELWPDDPMAHAYDAAALAERTRGHLIERQRPFIAKTVFSHRSKLDLIQAAKHEGYHVALHVLMVPEDLSVARVAYRVAAGGHDVPTDKIRARYRRLWAHVVEGVHLADAATCWDNSSIDGPRMAAIFSDGVVVGTPTWSRRTPSELIAAWPSG